MIKYNRSRNINYCVNSLTYYFQLYITMYLIMQV
jgi:hypothetical protein